MRRDRFGLVVALLAFFVSRSDCQPIAAEITPWTALMATPAGAIPPVSFPLSPQTLAEEKAFAFRYSRWSLPDNARNDVIGGSFLRRTSQGSFVSATVGYFRPGCGDCDGVLLIGADAMSSGRSTVLRKDVTAGINFAGSVGYGRDAFHDYVSASLGVPLEVAASVGNHVIAATLDPRAAVGSVDGSYGMLRVFGGSISWLGSRGGGVHLTASRVMIQNAVTNLGFAVSWR